MSSANILFLFVIFIGPLITISSSNWVVAWVGVELRFLGLIPLLFLRNKYISLRKEATLKYFCIQALRRAILFFRGLVFYIDFRTIFELGFIISLCLKLGLFPGHFWVPSIIINLEWIPRFLLLSWQKVAPLSLIVRVLRVRSSSIQEMVLFLGGASAVVGGLIGNNQTNIRAIIGSSSISHTGWVVIGAITGGLWVYFRLYCIVLFFTLIYLVQDKLILSLRILSLSGLPPFIIFVGKWKVISMAVSRVFFSVKFLILPVAGTLLSLVFYLKFLYSLYLSSEKVEWQSNFYSICPFIIVNFLGLGYLFI